MNQLSSEALDLTQTWLPLIAQVARASNQAELAQRCAVALASILPDQQAALVWQSEVAPGAVSAAILAQLYSDAVYPGDAERPGYLPIRSGALLGWLRVDSGGWSAEQEHALLMLAAVLGPARRALPIHEADDTPLRSLLGDTLDRLRTTLSLETLLEQTNTAILRICGLCHVTIALRYQDSDWFELAFVAEQGQRQHIRSFWKSQTGLVGAVVEAEQPIIVDDYQRECKRRGLDAGIPVVLRSLGMWVGAPLADVNGRPFGVITVAYDEGALGLVPRQLTLLLNFIAMICEPLRNARGYTRAQQQARQLAALNQIVRTINSSLDPAQVPALIIEQAQELLNAEEGSLLLLDTQTSELVFSYAGGPAGNQLLGQRVPAGQGIAGFVAGSGQTAISNDVRADGRFYGDADDGTGFVTRSLIAVPLRGIDGVRGVIEVMNRRDNAPFTEQDVALLEALADQAMIALENASRFAHIDQALARRAQELNRNNNQLQTILQVSRAMRAERRIDELLQQIASSVSSSIGFHSVVVALVQRDHAGEAYLQRMVAAGPASAALPRIRGARAPIQRVHAILREEFRRGSQTYLIDQRFNDYVQLWGGLEQLYLSSVPADERPGGWNPRDALFTLLRDNSGELLGLISIDDPDDGLQPSPTQVQILEIFANQAAVAIESAHLYSEQQHNLQRMTALNGLGMAINSLLRQPREIYAFTTRGMVEMTSATWAQVWLGRTSSELEPAFATGALPPDSRLHRGLASQALEYRRPLSKATPEALLAIPLRGTRRLLGVICLGYADGLPPPADLETLGLFANQAAVAVESLDLLDEVRQGRDQLASIMASTQEGMLLISHDSTVVVANAAFGRLTDLSLWSPPLRNPVALDGMPLDTLLWRWQAQAQFTPAEMVQLSEGLHSVALGRAPLSTGQLESDQLSGRSVEWTVLRAASAETSNATERWPILLTLRDITATKETERLRQDLSNMIVHDLRSPLTSIMTSIDMILRGVPEEPAPMQREILTIAFASAQHLLNMVNLLLDISRLEGGRMPLDRTPQAVETLLRRTVSRMSILAKSKQVTIESDPGTEGLLIYADGELLLRVLQNLLDNALKFSPKGGRVIVRAVRQHGAGHPDPQVIAAVGTTAFTTDEQQMVLVSVRDMGPGIKPNDQEKIFQKFAQAGTQRSTGTGLGLTFCKLVVEAHDGQIWVESQPGTGSTFFFTLPAATLHQE